MSLAVDGARRATGRAAVARSVAVLASGLLAGAVLAIWLVQAALGASGELYIEFRQATDPVYSRVLPPLGTAGLVAAVVALISDWQQVRRRWLTLGAVGCLVLGLAITLVVHFPINADLLTWSAAAPPTNWEAVRDRWVTAHAVRSVLAVAAFVLLLSAARAAEPERHQQS